MTIAPADRSAAAARMRRLIPLAKSVARSAGISLERYPPINTPPHHLRYLTRQLGINWVLDVGAHEGEYVGLLRRHVRFTGRIASFEPSAESFAKLAAACAGDRRWRGYAYALGRDPGHAELGLFGMSQLNSLLSPSSYGVEVFPLARDPDHLRLLELDCILHRPAAATGGRSRDGALG
jgi:FkbM family methyltransferase